MRALRLLAAGALLGAAPVLGLAPPSYAAEETRITHVQPTGDSVQVLVSVPEGATPLLDEVTVTVAGADAPATAERAEGAKVRVGRTAVLAIDTSNSMRGQRFAAAKAAATQFLDVVPADVRIGIVTFNREVTTTLAPTVDRQAARDAIEELTLARGTRLHDAIISAVALTGDDGQRQVLVLSDGANTNATPIEDVTGALSGSDVMLDAVALDQSAGDTRALEQMTDAAKGSVIPADPAALSAAFAAEASSLARQVLVTAEIPGGVTASEATLEVVLPTEGESLTASAYSRIRAPGHTSRSVTAPSADGGGLQVPREALYGGLVALGIGLAILLGSIMGSLSRETAPVTIEERIAAFGGAETATAAQAPTDGTSTLHTATQAAASMLERNRGLEARIEARLEAAGSALKPAEWLLLHGLIALLFGLFGLLLGNGSAILLVLFLLLGAFSPWLYLGFKRKARVKKFNSSLADTLQLVAGSLQAGMSLTQSIDTVVREGQEPVASEFRRVLVETRLGVPLETALEGIAQRLQSKDFGWVVMAIRIQREVGGNLAELLTTVAATLRERDFLRRQVAALAAEGKLSAYILIALPIGMLIYMVALRGDYVMPMFTTALGLMMSVATVLLMAMGWFMMSRIVKVEI